jgi:hypothetical protein
VTILLNRRSTIVGRHLSPAVAYAVEDLERDLGKVFVSEGTVTGCPIVLVPEDLPREQYVVRVNDEALEVAAGDDLGFIYGLYAISRELLGIEDLWFWNDQAITPAPGKEIDPSFTLVSTPAAVAYRGFFINDEVLLLGWSLDNDPDLPWRRVFETLYRLGGNLVIPGSGERVDHTDLAQSMGLYIAQHHACPLGARMFSEVYPGVEPRWPEERDRFEALWEEAVEARQGGRVVWTLGFRGQGDKPFWENDPRYMDAQSRAEVINTIVRRQYDIVRKLDPDAVCCIYLYDEAMDLYREGLLEYPDDVVKVWSDNGYGRMVSRMSGDGLNPRIPAMPDGTGSGGHGIYYHPSFFDMKASHHITHLNADPRYVARELEQVLANAGNDIWIINASNIKPHVYILNLIAALWREGSVDTEAVCRDYVRRYYGEGVADAVFEAFEDYWRIAVPFGPEWDDRAGELFFNFVPRMLITQFMKDRDAPSEELMPWMYVAGSLREQVEHYRSLCSGAIDRYDELVRSLERTALDAAPHVAELIRDTILLEARIYQRSIRGAALLCRSLLDAYAGDDKRAFYHAGLAREEYAGCDAEMRAREHGKWRDFYRQEALCEVKHTAWVLSALMGYLRALGDGPYYYLWQREFTYTREEKDVVIVLNLENRKNDDEIFAAMKTRWAD